VPVEKTVGSEVFAGTINGSGALEVTATKVAADTTLARIAAMVGDAQKERAHSEQWVERFARVYTPTILVVALLIGFVPPITGFGSLEDWGYRALVVLVIGCPCALVIATPVSIVSALSAAARQGVLVKGGRFVEVPASLKVVAVDKTGTLTEGRPSVVDVVPLDDHTADSLLAEAAGIETRSEHPIARAIVRRAEELGLDRPLGADITAVPGKGATGVVAGKPMWLGSHRWLEERGQETAAVHDRLAAMSAAGRTVVVVGTDDHVCGLVAVSDAVRSDAREAVGKLHAAGLRVVMLTGDNRETAEAVGREVGLDDVRAELLPSDKLAAVAELERLGPVAMVGDGVNDAPALARSSLGVAMGRGGTDVAIETADVALMGDDLGKLGWLVGHSKRTLRIIRQNTVVALGIKVVFFVLTLAGAASMWAAVAADMGASLLVTFNALRLLRR
jgi:Cd2+/Zn2+-exporting ATPase